MMLAGPALAGDYRDVGDRYFPETGGGVLIVVKVKEIGGVEDSLVCLSNNGKLPCKWR